MSLFSNGHLKQCLILRSEGNCLRPEQLTTLIVFGSGPLDRLMQCLGRLSAILAEGLLTQARAAYDSDLSGLGPMPQGCEAQIDS